MTNISTKNTSIHGISAAPWQLKVVAKELKAIILPLTGGWVSGDPSTWPSIETLESEVKVGDRIFLQEEWAYFLDKVDREVYYPLKRTSLMYSYGWEPAHTMPQDAAQRWYTVTGVRVCKACQLTSSEVWGAGLNITELEAQLYITLRLKWSAAHPGYPWDNNRPVVVLDVEAIAK
jgi:hypothetical protein